MPGKRKSLPGGSEPHANGSEWEANSSGKRVELSPLTTGQISLQAPTSSKVSASTMRFIGRLAERLVRTIGTPENDVWSPELLRETLEGATKELPPGKLRTSLESDGGLVADALWRRVISIRSDSLPAVSTKPMLQSKEKRAAKLGPLDLALNADVVAEAEYRGAAATAAEVVQQGLVKGQDASAWRMALQRLLLARNPPPVELWLVLGAFEWQLAGGSPSVSLELGPEAVESVAAEEAAVAGDPVEAAQAVFEALRPISLSQRDADSAVAGLAPAVAAAAYAAAAVSAGGTERTVGARGMEEGGDGLGATGQTNGGSPSVKSRVKLLRKLGGRLVQALALRRQAAAFRPRLDRCLPPPAAPSEVPLWHTGGAGAAAAVSTAELANRVAVRALILRLEIEVLAKLGRRHNDQVAGGDWRDGEVAALRALAMQSLAGTGTSAYGALLDALLAPALPLACEHAPKAAESLRGVLYEAALSHGAEVMEDGRGARLLAANLPVFLKLVGVVRRAVALFRSRGEHSRAQSVAAAASSLTVPPTLRGLLLGLRSNGALPAGLSLPSPAAMEDSRALLGWLLSWLEESAWLPLLEAALADSAAAPTKLAGVGLDSANAGSEEEEPLFFVDKQGVSRAGGAVGDAVVASQADQLLFAEAAVAMGDRQRGRMGASEDVEAGGGTDSDDSSDRGLRAQVASGAAGGGIEMPAVGPGGGEVVTFPEADELPGEAQTMLAAGRGDGGGRGRVAEAPGPQASGAAKASAEGRGTAEEAGKGVVHVAGNASAQEAEGGAAEPGRREAEEALVGGASIGMKAVAVAGAEPQGFPRVARVVLMREVMMEGGAEAAAGAKPAARGIAKPRGGGKASAGSGAAPAGARKASALKVRKMAPAGGALEDEISPLHTRSGRVLGTPVPCSAAANFKATPVAGTAGHRAAAKAAKSSKKKPAASPAAAHSPESARKVPRVPGSTQKRLDTSGASPTAKRMKAAGQSGEKVSPAPSASPSSGAVPLYTPGGQAVGAAIARESTGGANKQGRPAPKRKVGAPPSRQESSASPMGEIITSAQERTPKQRLLSPHELPSDARADSPKQLPELDAPTRDNSMSPLHTRSGRVLGTSTARKARPRLGEGEQE